MDWGSWPTKVRFYGWSYVRRRSLSEEGCLQTIIRLVLHVRHLKRALLSLRSTKSGTATHREGKWVDQRIKALPTFDNLCEEKKNSTDWIVQLLWIIVRPHYLPTEGRHRRFTSFVRALTTFEGKTTIDRMLSSVFFLSSIRSRHRNRMMCVIAASLMTRHCY